MALKDLAGTAVLQEALATTNAHLATVVEQLQEINGRRLEDVAAELRTLNAKVDRLLEQDRQVPQNVR